jgi:hypothetical protein
MARVDRSGEHCPICAKHRGEGSLVDGPLVWEDEQVLVFHRPPDATGCAFLGHLFVETRRHVPYLDELLGTRLHERHKNPRKWPDVPASRTAGDLDGRYKPASVGSVHAAS